MSSRFNDEPTLIDELDRVKMVQAVARDIIECNPPQVFGIHGKWGQGKTSFLQQLHWHLDGRCPEQTETERKKAIAKNAITAGAHKNHVIVIWFEAWRYANEPVPIVALMQEMRLQLEWYWKWLKEGQKLTEVTIRGALLAFEDITRIIGIQGLKGVKASSVQQIGEQWEKDHFATKLSTHHIREQLNEAIGKLLGKKSQNGPEWRLVVLIDDLDRCQDDVAYRLLEGIKIYLNLQRCVFVLGMNQDIIEDAIHRCFQQPGSNQGNSKLRAREYLDKICQDIYHLPALPNRGEFLKKFIDPGDTLQIELCDIAQEYKCLPANPRKIKGFAGILQRFAEQKTGWATYQGRLEPQRCMVLLFIAYLYHFHYPIYRQMEHEPRFYIKLYDWAKATEGSSDLTGDKLHPLLRSPLQRTLDPILVDNTPVPSATDGNPLYSDPDDAAVFYAQRLILNLGPDVTEDAINACLLR